MIQSPQTSCLSAEQLTELVEGLLSGDAVSAAEGHLAVCSGCRVLVAEAARSVSDGVADARADAGFALHPIDASAYEVGREIARGGMGRILEAWDRRHQRRVAIKMLLREGEAAAQRFAREVRVTSRLQHPAIIPLYEAGLWPGGEPFFSMRLVSGRPLGEVVSEANTPAERLALLPNVIALTEALAYAHEQGVVHRDLKPGNVLVGAFGETVVIDWGLAKELQTSEPRLDDPGESQADAALTVHGRALGTPCYMPPEQARGEPVDERADVYALGALLYHVFAGEPPFSGSSDEALARVLAGPPRPLEERVPQLAPDLLAIVAKAMARAPGDRYATAKAMADDLRRFTDGRLVSAHRYSLGTLARRWVRKHRAAVSVGAALLALLAVTATLSVHRIVRERDRADQLKTVAERKERSAVARRDAADNLVEYMVTDLRTRLAAVGRLDLLAGVGAEVKEYYGSVATLEDAETPTSLAHHAAALDVAADVEASKNQYAAARAELADAIALRQRALALAPGDRETRAALVASYLSLSGVEADLTNADGALAADQRAVELASVLAAEEPSSRRWEALDAEAQRALAARLAERGDSLAELDARKSARDALLRLVEAEPQNVDAQRQLGEADIELGRLEIHVDHFADANASERAALLLLDPLVARDPDDAALEMQRSRAVQLLGGAEFSVGDLEAGFASYQRCAETRDRLVTRDPVNAEWQRLLAQCLGGMVEVGIELDRLGDARTAQLRALAIDRAAVARNPDNERALRDVVYDDTDMGRIELGAGRYPEALESFSAALAVLEPLRARDPARVEWKKSQTEALRDSTLADLALGRLGSALEKAREANASAAELAADVPHDDAVLCLRATTEARLGKVRARRHELVEARAILAASLADFDAVVDRNGLGGEWMPDAPEAARDLARILAAAGERAQARELLAKTVSALESLEAQGLLPARRRSMLAAVRAELAALGGERP